MADIWIKILGDASKLKSELGKAGGDVSSFSEKIGKIGKTMTVVGGAVTAIFGMIIKKTMDVGDQFDKMSLRTGIAVEDLSSLAYACDLVGTDIGGLEIGLKFLTKGMDDASKGTGEAKDAFKELGISITDTEGNLRPTIEVLKEAATKIAAIENPAKQAALAMELFGARSGTQLIPLLKEGGAGIEELMKKAEELGITISTETASAAAELKDRLTDLKGSLAGVGRDIGTILIPPLTGLVEKAVEMVKRIKEWADTHKPLIDMIVKLGATIGVMAAVGGPILLAVSALMKMKAAITVMGTISSGPIGIAIVAIAALAAGYLVLKENIKSTEDYMSDFRVGLQKITELEALDALILELTNRIEKLDEGLKQVGPGEEYDDLLKFYETLTTRLEEATKKREELTKIEVKSFEDILAEVNKMAEIGDILQPAEEAIQNIIDSLNPYEEALKAVNDRYDEAIEKIKTYITDEEELKAAIDKLNEGRKAEITLMEKEQTGLEETAEAKKKLIGLTKSLTDKIYEFTHTELEVTLRDINREYDLLIENAREVYESQYELVKAIKIINEERQKEIDTLKESNEVKNITIDKNIELAESIEPTIEKTKEATEVTKQLGILGGESFSGFTTQIKHATTALSNFSKEGVASAIASIKMHFKPLLDSLINDINRCTGVWKRMAEVNLAELKKSMNDQIAVIKYGYEEYKKVLASMSGGISSIGGGSILGGAAGAGGGYFASYQTGIRSVPETQLALVHKGEEINPPGQRSYDQRKSYSNVVNIYNPVVRNDNDIAKIERSVKDILDKDSKQRLRQGNEIMLGA